MPVPLFLILRVAAIADMLHEFASIGNLPPKPNGAGGHHGADRQEGKMKLEDLKNMDRETITPAMAAEVLGCDPLFIRTAARTKPELLPFPFFRSGNRTHILRRAFIAYVEGLS